MRCTSQGLHNSGRGGHNLWSHGDAVPGEREEGHGAGGEGAAQGETGTGRGEECIQYTPSTEAVNLTVILARIGCG